MIFPYIDKLGERVMALGGTALGTAKMSAENSDLDEFPMINDGMQVVEALADRYAIVANYSREGIDTTENLGDMASSDLLIDFVRALDRALWFLEAHIQ